MSIDDNRAEPMTALRIGVAAGMITGLVLGLAGGVWITGTAWVWSGCL